MLPIKSVLALLLMGAVPAEVPAGTFKTWLSFKKGALDFLSAGVIVHVEALPCPDEPVGDSTCRWEGYNNQAAVTVRARGLTPITVLTDSQSAYARIAVVRFDSRDRQPGIIVESQSGGSGGDLTAQLLVPHGKAFRILPFGDHARLRLQGQIEDNPHDMSGDGRLDLELKDAAFDSAFGCNACSPRPPKFFAVKNGKIVDQSGDAAFRTVYATRMKGLAPGCLSTAKYRNGTCAAYVADAARAGQFRSAWAAMLKHYEHGVDVWQSCSWVRSRPQNESQTGAAICYRDFPESLRAFLKRTGYLSSSVPAIP